MKTLILLICATALAAGCGLVSGRTRGIYDHWFPPGSTRQQITRQYGQPQTSVRRPKAVPTDQDWLNAVMKEAFWLHPTWFVYGVRGVERKSGQRVHRLDTLSPPSHWSWMEKHVFLFRGHTDVVYYNNDDIVISSQKVPSNVPAD